MGLHNAVSDHDLTDFSLEGHLFSWIKSRDTDRVVEERLDRALTNSIWMTKFPNVRLVNLIASHSNHNPILLQCKPLQRTHTKYSFKFENKWLKEEKLAMS